MPQIKPPRDVFPKITDNPVEMLNRLDDNVPYLILKEETFMKLIGIMQMLGRATGTFDTIEQAFKEIALANGAAPRFIKGKKPDAFNEISCKDCPNYDDCKTHHDEFCKGG